MGGDSGGNQTNGRTAPWRDLAKSVMSNNNSGAGNVPVSGFGHSLPPLGAPQLTGGQMPPGGGQGNPFSALLSNPLTGDARQHGITQLQQRLDGMQIPPQPGNPLNSGVMNTIQQQMPQMGGPMQQPQPPITSHPLTGGPMPLPAETDGPQHKFRQMMAMQDQSLPMRFLKQNNPRYQAEGSLMPARGPRFLRSNNDR